MPESQTTESQLVSDLQAQPIYAQALEALQGSSVSEESPLGTVNEANHFQLADGRTTQESLYIELGRRLTLLQQDHRVAQDFAPAIPPLSAQPAQSWLDLGRGFFERVAINAYPLFCGKADLVSEKDRNSLLKAIGVGDATSTALITAGLVSFLGMAPIVAPVVAALISKLFLSSSIDIVCADWASKLPPK